MNVLNHVEFNVSDLKRSAEFYDMLFKYFGWKKILEEKDIVGWRLKDTSVFIVQAEKRFLKAGFHRKRAGLNHLCFLSNSREEVDEFHQFLKGKKIPILYGGPKDWPEYKGGYYAVYFEDPDRIKLELAYIPSESQNTGKLL